MKLFSLQIYHIFLRNRDFASMYPTNDNAQLEIKIKAVEPEVKLPTRFIHACNCHYIR